jgi:GT2 family glycosyltransferase
VSPRVSAIVVNLDGGPLLEYALPSLARQSCALEVIVVDNGSRDGSDAAIVRRWPGTHVIRLGRNTGFSHALNVGIREARAELLLSVNLDVVLEDTFVAVLVDALDRHPRAGWAAGCMRRLTPAGVLDSIDCCGHWMLPSRYCYGYDPAQPAPSAYTEERYVFGASACAALYRRAMLDDVALDGEVFDEQLFAYFEDVDLDWRAQQRGWRCLYVPAARGAHMRGGSGLWRRSEVAALLLANRFLVMLKNDELADVVHDLSPILRRTARDVLMYGRRMPGALPLAAWRAVRLAPAMLVKRRRMRPRRRVSAGYFRALTVRTSFLG